MKKMLPIIIAVIFAACKTTGVVRAEFIYATLVKIDEVYRYHNNKYVLTLRCKDNKRLVSFVDKIEPYKLGDKYRVILTK